MADVGFSPDPIAAVHAENRALRAQLAQVEQRLQDQMTITESLTQSHDRYRALITALHEGIVVHDHSGAILECNPRAEAVLGLTADQLMGRTSIDPRWRAIHPDGTPFPGETHPAMVALHTGQPQRDVIMGIHTPDGRLTWLFVNAQPIFHAETDRTTPVAVVASLTDITDQKRIQDTQQACSVFSVRGSPQLSLIRHIPAQDEYGSIALTHERHPRATGVVYDKP